jgi:hypothetical protein
LLRRGKASAGVRPEQSGGHSRRPKLAVLQHLR